MYETFNEPIIYRGGPDIDSTGYRIPDIRLKCRPDIRSDSTGYRIPDIRYRIPDTGLSGTGYYRILPDIFAQFLKKFSKNLSKFFQNF